MTSTSLVNDGNTATNIIEATVSGSSGSNVAITNAGNVTIAEYVSSTLTNLFQVITGTGVKLGATGRQVEIIGNLLVDGTLSLKSVTATGAVSCSSATATGLVTGTSMILTTGSITRISVGNTNAGSNTSYAITHNLGATPDIVLLSPSQNLGAGYGSYAAYNYTSTQFTIYHYDNVSAQSSTYNWLAIKL